jgi:pyridoxine 5-phosphate synthase
MTKLSVNINKIALIRNARGGNQPDLLEAARKAEQFGAQGITVHPRPDARHITFDDVHSLKRCVETELNVEGYPSEEFMELVLSVKPHQVTLVPDAPDALTSNAGWDTLQHEALLTDVVGRLKSAGIRTSIFMDTNIGLYESAARTRTDRIELYTEAYAHNYATNPQTAVEPYRLAALEAHKIGLGLNAGHDLNSQNLRFFAQNIPHLLEVSIGHALICEALYLGLEHTINLYRAQLQ